jgi:two-component system, OmpR family, phosphate regulon sensor histidine kinase PhoR
MTGWMIAAVALVAVGMLARALINTRSQLHRAEQRAAQIERDLTAQLKHQECLRETLLRATDDVLLVLDAEQKILFVNPAAEALLGQDLVGETLIGALRQPELETLIQDAQLVMGEGVERRIEYQRHILHARAVVSNNGAPALEVLTLRDVTELQRLERARREMVSNITHELSTPITTIGLLAETILSFDKEKPKRTRKMAKDIQREAETLAHLVQEMRDLSLIESGQMPIRMTPINLLATIQASIDPLTTLADGKNQTITVDVPEDLWVLGDDLQLRRAVKNILHNAVKFSPEDGKIQVTATVSGGEVIIAVSDEGPGIPPEDLSRVFERFFQVDRARRDGTGLGLAIVRHIVLAHGGRVWAESVEGEGATFFIALAQTTPEGEAG